MVSIVLPFGNDAAETIEARRRVRKTREAVREA